MVTDKPIAIDLYPCQGGATYGLQQAGFYVIGVDIVDQPRYIGDEFYRGDAIAWLLTHRDWVRKNAVLVAGSPPCQLYSLAQRIQKRDHPDLIGPTRASMQEVGVPYVIENVEEARGELRGPVMLCGPMFGLHTYRHRLFETGGWHFTPPEHPAHTQKTIKMGRALKPGDFYHAVGNFSSVEYVRQDMGVPWMSRDGIRECIPPAYGEYVGRAFLAQAMKDAA